jgi:prepilin-type N-terminal cleavage/methylation domain-containing protein
MAPPRQPKRGRPPGFSLVEMLVVIALLAILMGLMVPAINGLIGISGPRGGVNAVAAAIDNAKLAAMESGVNTYLAFPTSSANTENAFSHMIIFRQQTAEEQGLNPDADPDQQGGQLSVVPLSRWIALPEGVFFESDQLSEVETESASLPPLEGEEIQNLETISFDRYGRLADRITPATIRIGEKAEPTGEFTGEGQPHFNITVQPLTGRASVRQIIGN